MVRFPPTPPRAAGLRGDNERSTCSALAVPSPVERAESLDGEAIADEILATQRNAAEATTQGALALVRANDYEQLRQFFGTRQAELRRVLRSVDGDDRLPARDKARIRRALNAELESIERLVAASRD